MFQTLHDLDAEDEKFTLSFTLTAGGLVDEATGGAAIADWMGTSQRTLTIEDDETRPTT